MNSNRGRQTAGESFECFLCDFWWLILLIIALIIAGWLLYSHFLRPAAPEISPATTQTLGTGDIQVTLSWHDLNDVDLWVTDPSGEQLMYSHPTSASGGKLDVDANRECMTNITQNGIENIFWPTGKAPSGKYTVYVNFYEQCDNQPDSSNFTVRVLANGVTKEYTGTVSTSNPTVQVAEIQK